MRAKAIAYSVLALTLINLSGLPAIADEPPTRPGPTWAEFSRLQQEVTEQRSLMIQLMQSEQQRYDMLLRLIQPGTQGAGAAVALPPLPSMAGSSDSSGGKGTARAVGAAPEKKRAGSLEGTITVPGGDFSDVYVYLEDISGPPTRGRQVEIKQENKQFIPRVAVVQVGTTVSFPNLDPIFHNVFSNSPRNSFDLGSYRAGDKVRSVVMSTPGVVDIFCNMHQRMSANVLVVPSRFYTRVKPDGSFHFDNVPLGTREVVVWSPNLKPQRRRVEVGPDGTKTTFALEYTELKAHNNKLGQAYGSYKD